MFRPALTFLVAASCAVFAQVPDGELVDLAATRLNRSAIPQLGLVALASKSDWKHGETANFIYHFTERTTAAPIAAEAEFFYRVIARELERDTTQWEQKAHIFVFETDEEWRAFQTRGMLDPRSGGIHAAGALFLKRRGAAVMNNETLAHEVAHLVAGRFFGLGIPLWLNEGFAENSSIRCRAAFMRARGYDSKPRFRSVTSENYIPLQELTALAAYPSDTVKMITFYDQSEKLTRFLMTVDRKGFSIFMESLAKGNRIETALGKAYPSRFPALDSLEREFKPFAISSVVPSNL
jgi:hypothetical protein